MSIVGRGYARDTDVGSTIVGGGYGVLSLISNLVTLSVTVGTSVVMSTIEYLLSLRYPIRRLFSFPLRRTGAVTGAQPRQSVVPEKPDTAVALGRRGTKTSAFKRAVNIIKRKRR